MRKSANDICERIAFTLGGQASCVVRMVLRDVRRPSSVTFLQFAPAQTIVLENEARPCLRLPDASSESLESEAA